MRLKWLWCFYVNEKAFASKLVWRCLFAREGQSLTLARTSTPLCAVAAMQEYFVLVRHQHGSLFFFASGRDRYLTRGIVSDLLRDSARVAGLPYQCLKGHSFRIGAASVAAAACLPDCFIKVLGRWSSDCYQLYIRTPQSTLESVAPRMAIVPGRFQPI